MLALKLAKSIPSQKQKFNVYSVDFDGTDEGINISTAGEELSGSTGTFTTWVKLGEMATSGVICKALNDSNNNINLFYHGSNAQVTFNFKGGGTAKSVVITDAIGGDGRWHNITATWDTGTADEIKIYLDGALKQTKTTIPTLTGTLTNTWLGNNTAGGSYGILKMANFGMFKKVIDVNLLVSSDVEPLDLTGIDGLVGYYKLDSGIGETAFDASGENDNGSIVNSPTWSTDVPYKTDAQ
jgi:hypothetical protein